MNRAIYNFPVELQPIYLKNRKKIENRRAVVRTDTMNALGVVSGDYGLVKHKTVIDLFRRAGKKYGVEEKVSLTKDGAQLFYQMTFPKVEMEVSKGDIVKMMMIAKNSYNGMNSLQIVFGAFRLVCENGMIIGTQFMSFNFKHIGNVGGMNDKDIVKTYRKAYADHIKLFNERMPFITAMARRSMSEVEGTYEMFNKEEVALPDYLLEEARASYENGNDNTVWGYYNALTYAITHKMRKNSPDLAIRYGMEAWKAAESVMNS